MAMLFDVFIVLLFFVLFAFSGFSLLLKVKVR